MRRRVAALALPARLLAVAVRPRRLRRGRAEAGEPAEVVEGEPLELGELDYNVQITRFLNPDDAEDAEYLVGQPPRRPGTSTSASSW